MQQVNIQYYNSPCGEIILASVGDELCLCDWNEMPCAERNNLIPCHRVIGSNHSLTGFAGGLVTKRILLELETGQKQHKLLIFK
ncbi:MGMT family protein [Segatella copri]|uniref:MGMT family protein n=1 Tax=Segatella copri TaxID=165179 RepID=UPI001F2235CC|nr:MGMT family protein [Segatella copri]MCW4073536.1 MGMT family protein [Segatella copri]